MHRPGLLLLLLAALACGPTGGHRAQQPIAATSAPEPMMACVDDVLANSAHVERISTTLRDDYPRSRNFTLRNPPSPRVAGMGFVVTPSQGAPREFVVGFVWPGPWQGRNGMQSPPDRQVLDGEGEMLADIGARLLREVRAQCAPTAPGTPVCTRVREGRGGRCVLGT